jgi:uncharacterized PurR-regulated membrane protein YhhQ (DUF165 family)
VTETKKVQAMNRLLGREEAELLVAMGLVSGLVALLAMVLT